LNKKGVLTVISGFSGSGKGTVVNKLLNDYKDEYSLSISATTRQPRVGEEDGKHYFFITREQFEEKIKSFGLIEWAEYVGNYYGTPREYVENKLAEGKNVILEIEMQGGLQIKKQCPEAVLIFMVPPSASELRDRLIKRGTEDLITINKRLERASAEIEYISDYDYIVINNDINICADEIHSIIKAEHNKVKKNSELIETIKNDFRI